ncbi:MAG TPA: hypothetical protein DCG75_08030 [Bacteroidales bacterium]|nr:hypothetical protein [Bacteroidales bacterium]
MNDKIKNFPIYSDVIKSVSNMKDLTLPKFSIGSNVDDHVEKITKLFTNEFGWIPNIINLFTPREFPFKIYRVRELSSFTNTDLFTEYSYPPINKVGMGRCNFPNYPVFYCSDNAAVALIEVVRESDNPNRKYCISKWEINPSDEKFVFQSFLETDIPRENIYSELNVIQKNKINKLFANDLNEEMRKGLFEYLKYLNNVFISDKNYSISASLVHRILYPKSQFTTDMLMYPSAQTMYKGINIVIHPNFVENQMKITRFYIAKCDNYNPKTGIIKSSFLKYADIKKNQINWKNINPDDILFQKYVREDFSDLIKPNSKFKFYKE